MLCMCCENGENALLHLVAAHEFIKNTLKFNRTTCNKMIYKCYMCGKLLENNETKFSQVMYDCVHDVYFTEMYFLNVK